VSSTATTRSSTAAARSRTARLRAAHLQAALLRAARARRIRLERAARERQRVLRAQRAAQTPPPAQTTTPVVDPTTLFIDPAQPLLFGLLAPYQTPEAAAAASNPVAAALLPISTAASAAALLAGVSTSASTTQHASAPAEPVLTPSGGFNGAARFERFLQAQSAPAQPLAASDVGTPVISRAPVLTDATGGRVLEAVAGGGRGTGLNTPLGRIAIRHGDYVFGTTRYPIASVGGVLTTALIALAALAGIAALLAAIAAVGRFLEAGVRRGGERTREELYAAARRMNIPGRSHMSNAELRRALDDRQSSH
jgi:hypothetical protein